MSETQAMTLPAWWYTTPRNKRVKIQLCNTDVNKQTSVSELPVTVVQRYGFWCIYIGANYRGCQVRKLDALKKAMRMTHYRSTMVEQQIDGQLPILSNL